MATSTFALMSTLAAAGVLLGFLHRATRRRWEVLGVATVQARDLIALLVPALLVLAVQVAVLVAVAGGDLWDLMSVVYLDLVVAVPVVAGAVLVAAALHRRWPEAPTATRPALVLAAIGLVPALVGLYATHVEPYRLGTDEVAVPVAPERRGADPLVVGVLADIQTIAITDHERAAVARVMAADPDLILLPGDVFQGTAAQYEDQQAAFRELFGQLEAPGGVWLVPGDVDTRAELDGLVEGTDVRVLEDEVVTVDVGDRRVQVGGVTLTPTGAGLDVVRRLETAEGAQVRILLAHRPDWVLRLVPDSRIDLVVAGHTHGGQVQVPGFGPLMTMSDVPRDVAAGGLHTVDGNQVYVSPGVGREQQGAPSIRFLAPPSVGVLSLTDGVTGGG